MRADSARVTLCYTEMPSSKMMKYYYEKGDYENMRNKLENVNWYDILCDGSIHEQWLHFKKYIKSPEEEFIPHRLITKFKRTLSPYFRNSPLLHITISLHLTWRLLKFMQWLARKQYLLRRRSRQLR